MPSHHKKMATAILPLVAIVLVSTTAKCAMAQTGSQDARDAILQSLLKQVEENPNHSDSWRLLGKLCIKRNDIDNAMVAFKRALEAMPENAAAHYDLGTLQQKLGMHAESTYHLQKVFDLSPDSEYANRLLAAGFKPDLNKPPVAIDGEADFISATDLVALNPGLSDSVEPASYKIQTFDGADDLQRRLDQLQSQPGLMGDPAKRWRIFGETGALYNSNVTLTPVSRELATAGAASAQWFANTELEWTAHRTDLWRAGPIGRGYFTVNESDLSNLNLSSFQSGAFVERELGYSADQMLGRLEYMYSIDQFDGETFGDRHSLTASMTRVCEGIGIDYFYASLGNTQFDDDGADPAIFSMDGNTYTVGASRFFLTSSMLLPTWSIGLDFESADTEGADFRYYSVRGHAEATFLLSQRWSLNTSTGLGFRNYPDFASGPSRDEINWRVGAKLSCQVKPRWIVSLVTNYDRFASDNDSFDVDRFTAGIITTFRY